MLKRFKSPVVLTVIIGGAVTALKTVQAMPNATWIDYAIVGLGYIGAVVGALNNPTDKEGF